MKIKKIVLIVLSLIFVVALMACNNGENLDEKNLGKENVTQNDGKVEEEIEKKKLFYYVGSELIAIGENGIIIPIDMREGRKITYGELLSEEYYTAYSLKEGTNRKLDKVNLAVFLDESDNENKNLVSVLMPYGKKVATDTTYLSDQTYDVYELDLPVDITNEMSEMDASLKIGDNGYGYVLELEKYDTFVTNANFNINFEQKSEDVELSENVANKIKEYINNNEIANDVPYACTNKLVTDLDGDNKVEKIYAIETNAFNENNFDANVSKTGALSLILIERENEEVEIMFESKIKPFNYVADAFWNDIYGYINELQIFIADIDNDNDKEIIVDANIIEPEGGGIMKFYSISNGRYEEVNTSYYGCGN